VGGKSTYHRTRRGADKEYTRRYHRGDHEITIDDLQTGQRVKRYEAKVVSPAKRNPYGDDDYSGFGKYAYSVYWGINRAQWPMANGYYATRKEAEARAKLERRKTGHKYKVVKVAHSLYRESSNPSVRVGKFKGRTTHPSGGPISLRQQFAAKSYVGRHKKSRPRYLVGFGKGSTYDYINTQKLSTAKTKGEAHAKKKGWDSFWVQNQVTGSILQFKVIPGGRSKNPGGPLDTHAAKELELFVENDADLYRQQYTPINKNLITKMARGVYNHAGAVKLFGYLMESGAKKYAKQYSGGSDWHQIFSPATRKAVAEVFAKHFEVEAKLGNYDNLLPKKYSQWRLKSNPNRMCDVLVRKNGQTFKAKAKYDAQAKRVRIFVPPGVAAKINPQSNPKVRLVKFAHFPSGFQSNGEWAYKKLRSLGLHPSWGHWQKAGGIAIFLPKDEVEYGKRMVR
jgi:hypothetical protein